MAEFKYKRYCKTLRLEDDPELIEKYTLAHGIGKVWPEIGQGMREVGIIDMEIYIHGNILFMIMDTVHDFDHEKAFKELASKPLQSEWEAHMSQFQKTTANASADEKWQLMERIFELDQKKEYKSNDGQEKAINAD
jgi:L-rhamnose mutarotase